MKTEQYVNIFKINKEFRMTLRPGVFIVKYEVSGLIQFLAFGSPFKMIKNAFCFTFKTLIVLKIFNSCLDFLVT